MIEKNYAGYTEEEVARSLQIIQGICRRNGGDNAICDVRCPFLNIYDNGVKHKCLIGVNRPVDWELNPIPPKIWTPFK